MYAVPLAPIQTFGERSATQLRSGPGNSVAEVRNRQFLAWMDPVRVGDAAGVGDPLVFASVTVEAFRDRPQGVTGDQRVCPRSGWRRRGCRFGLRCRSGFLGRG